MRIDKYLKVSRLIKRRTIAASACDAGKIKVNDKLVKPSFKVKVGDTIEIKFNEKATRVKVTKVMETSKKEEAVEMFEYIDEK